MSSAVTQRQVVYKALFERPMTMLMVSRQTDVDRANICRLIAKWRKEDKIYFVQKGICEVSKASAGYFTTNRELYLELKSRQS